MSTSVLPSVVVETSANPTCAVIWLHGLGADGHDFEPLVPALGFSDRPAVRFVFPHAPSIPVTINGGMVMPAWYDIRSLGLDDRADVAGVRAAADRVAMLIRQQEQAGIPADRIVLAGFSQGGAVAVHLGLRFPERLAGILALSTYLAAEGDLDREQSPANQPTPVFCAHGRFDPMVPAMAGHELAQRVQGLGHPTTIRTYAMGHEVCQQEIADLAQWLHECLPG